jgi:hypothetical protein
LVLPGAAQLLRGQAGRGAVLVAAWLAALIAWQPDALLPLKRLVGIDFQIDLLHQRTVPAGFQLHPLTLLAIAAMVAVWISGNAWRWRRRES